MLGHMNRGWQLNENCVFFRLTPVTIKVLDDNVDDTGMNYANILPFLWNIFGF